MKKLENDCLRTCKICLDEAENEPSKILFFSFRLPYVEPSSDRGLCGQRLPNCVRRPSCARALFLGPSCFSSSPSASRLHQTYAAVRDYESLCSRRLMQQGRKIITHWSKTRRQVEKSRNRVISMKIFRIYAEVDFQFLEMIFGNQQIQRDSVQSEIFLSFEGADD